jgi:hypothetical protein
MGRSVWDRVLQYLDAIDKRGTGYAIWMDFFRIAGSTLNTNRAVKKLSEEYKLIRVEEDGDRSRYFKTEWGQKAHELLKAHDYLGPFWDEMSESRFSSNL